MENDELRERLRSVENRLEALETVFESTTEESPTPTENGVPWWVSEYRHGPGELGGIITDEVVARNTPCLRYDLGDDSELVFSKGIVGALDTSQKALYCSTVETKETPPELQERLRQAKQGIEVCKVEVAVLPEGERIEAWIKCIGREWRERKIGKV